MAALPLKKLFRLARYDWPLHFVLVATNWLPDNVVFLRLRGGLAGHFLGSSGNDLRLGRNVTFYNPSLVSLGSSVYIAYGCWFMAGDRIVVEDEVMFGPYCVVVSSEHARSGNSFRSGGYKTEPILIGRGSWIGAHVTVTAGSTIGCGSLVGANALVRGQVPDHVMAAGQPARVIKRLDD